MQCPGYREHGGDQLCACPLGTPPGVNLPADSPRLSSGQRFLFIDLYRTGVILLMLEGHVFRALLQRDVQQSDLFQLHEFFHGLSAPAFLFGAGMTFVISTRRRWAEYHHWGEAVAGRLRRFLLIIALGLVMHLPFFSLRKIMLDASTADILRFFQTDVLVCIGVGLIVLQGLVFFFKTETRFYTAVAIVTALICFLTPFAWDIEFMKFLPLPAAQLFNGIHGSSFPLFPFAGFLFAGAIVSWEFLAAADRGEERRFAGQLALAGIAMIGTAIVLEELPIRLYPTANYWFTSPNYFLIRLGGLLLIICGFWYLGGRLKQAGGMLTMLGRESLFVYVTHLFALYGSAVNPQLNLQALLGTELSFGASASVFASLLIALLAGAACWNYLRSKALPVYRLLQLGGSGLFLYYFFTRDF